LRHGETSTTLKSGCGRGYSVLETIDAVRRVSGRGFAVQCAPRHAGDIMAVIADTSRIWALLDWKPQYEDIETIAGPRAKQVPEVSYGFPSRQTRGVCAENLRQNKTLSRRCVGEPTKTCLAWIANSGWRYQNPPQGAPGVTQF